MEVLSLLSCSDGLYDVLSYLEFAQVRRCSRSLCAYSRQFFAGLKEKVELEHARLFDGIVHECKKYAFEKWDASFWSEREAYSLARWFGNEVLARRLLERSGRSFAELVKSRVREVIQHWPDCENFLSAPGWFDDCLQEAKLEFAEAPHDSEGSDDASDESALSVRDAEKLQRVSYAGLHTYNVELLRLSMPEAVTH